MVQVQTEYVVVDRAYRVRGNFPRDLLSQGQLSPNQLHEINSYEINFARNQLMYYETIMCANRSYMCRYIITMVGCYDGGIMGEAWQHEAIYMRLYFPTLN